MGRPRELTGEERAELLAKGYKPVEVWVPDWDSAEFKARIKNEMDLIAAADAKDPTIDEWIRQVRGDLWDDDAP
jgi:hypothetical protein